MCNEAARLRSLGEIAADFSELKIPLRFPEGLPNLGAAPSIRITDTTAIVRAARGQALEPSGENARTRALGRDHPASEGDHDGAHEMVQRRWSWLGPAASGRAGKPVYNYRSEGREFRNGATGGRCLIPLDGFYEFTDAGTVADGAAEEEGALSLPLQGQWAPPSPAKAGEGAGAVEGLALTLPLQRPRVPPSPSRGEGKTGKAKKDKWLFALSSDAGAAWNPAGRAAPGLLCVAGLWRVGDLGGAGGAATTGEAWTMLTCAPGPDIAPYHHRQIVLMPRDRWADWLGGVVPAGELIAPTPAGTLVATRAR